MTPTGTPERAGRRWHWKRIVLITVPVIVILAVGGPFVYIHFIEGKPPAKLSVNSAPAPAPAASAAGGATVALDGTWAVGSGSTAGYRVKEILFGQSTTAVGRTSDADAVTGSMTIAGSTVSEAAFTVKLDSVHSDQSNRDNQFRGRIMDVDTYPTAAFALTKPIALGSQPAVGKTISVPATGTFTAHGHTRTVTITLTGRRDASDLVVSGSIPVTFADYSIPNPSFGPAQTSDNGTVEFLLRMRKS